MKPPIRTLSPVSTRKRVEMFPRIAGEALGVAVGVSVGLGVAVGVGVDVGVGIGLAVAVGVGVEVGPDCAQYLPPVPNWPAKLSPPQTIIWLPVHTPVEPLRALGALA